MGDTLLTNEVIDQEGGGMFDVLLGVSRIRGQKYEKWLEQRLILVHDDADYVNQVRRKFGYDKTNIVGRGQLTKEQIKEEVCERNPEDLKEIAPSLDCEKDTKGGYRKTSKHKKRKGRKGKKITRKHKK